MNNIERVEAYYKQFTKNLNKWLPEGMVEVEIAFLQEYGLLHFEEQTIGDDDALTRYFHVVESDEKITLVNEQFVIWIVPEQIENISKTFCFIALNTEKIPRLETAFCVSGVYNTSKLVLRVLEKLLQEVVENEEALNQLKKAS